MKIMKAKQKLAGFSIIEIMAVIFIVTIGMIGMMNLIGQSIRVQRLNKHTLIAYQLAQEGIELIRVIRDNNWLDEEDVSTFIATLIPGDYCLDIDNINLLTDSELPCPLYLNEDNLYVHQVGDNLSPYARLISISDFTEEGLEDNQAVSLVVEITWQDAGTNISYMAETKLYNWY